MQIAQELGDDAVILSTRTSQGPEGDSIVEIVAAIDENAKTKSSSVKESENKHPKRPLKDKLTSIPQLLQGNGEAQQSKPLQAYRELQNSDELIRRIEAMESQLGDINSSLKYKYSNSLSPVSQDIYEKLIDSEFPEDKVLEAIGKANIASLAHEPEKAKEAAYKQLLRHVSIGKPIRPNEDRSCITSAFVGTTGNGKTSTLVKIALVCKLVYGSKCLLVSADKHKVGGSDQLRTFASIADMDYATAYSKEEIKKVLDEKEKYDFVFFDTAGRSQNDNKNLLEVSEQMKTILPDRIFLVIATNLSQMSVSDILQKYTIMPVTDIILTKLDEASRMGGPITALYKSRAPLTYLSYGQEIPDDIQPASRESLLRLIDRAGATIRNYEAIFEGGDS